MAGMSEQPHFWTLLAGAVGGIVSLRFFEELTIWKRFLTVTGGVATSHFLTHPIIKIFSLQSIDEGPGTGFVLGLFAMSLAAAGFRMLQTIDWEKIRSFFPGGR
jgi:hypothetical protein